MENRIIKNVYERYKIMPSLQLHMLRVAGVASMLCDYHKKAGRNDIIAACLLHDMGNIIKSDLSLFPEFLEPQGIDYWKGVKGQYIQKYGEDEHAATLAIINELRVPKDIILLVNGFRFAKEKETYESGDLNRMICSYSDMRVGPRGVTTLDERLKDGYARFRIRSVGRPKQDIFDEMRNYVFKTEKVLFRAITLDPSDITENIAKKRISLLKEFELPL